tara:strand:+ start:751 stop:1098 length:348 start_codon:yes stop_codon:yes gene_type:complete
MASSATPYAAFRAFKTRLCELFNTLNYYRTLSNEDVTDAAGFLFDRLCEERDAILEMDRHGALYLCQGFAEALSDDYPHFVRCELDGDYRDDLVHQMEGCADSLKQFCSLSGGVR